MKTPALLAVSSLALVGCGKLVGIDEYHVGEVPESPPDCRELEVSVEGECQTIGVAACKDGFEPDGHGGCTARRDDACGAGKVSAPGDIGCRERSCYSDDYAVTPRRAYPLHLFVNANPQPDAPERPLFPTIGEALRYAAGEPATIFLAPGEYEERLELSAQISIVGACTARTAVIAPDDSGPAIRVSSGANVRLEFFQVRGGSPAVFASGASLYVRDLWVRDPAGPGILVDDTQGPAVLELSPNPNDSLLIEGARGVGLTAHGDVKIIPSDEVPGTAKVFVRGTRLLEEGRGGYGISLHPSPLLSYPEDVSAAAPSLLERVAVVLEDNAGAGLLVEGSRARLERAVISRTRRNGAGEGYGILVLPRPYGDIAAALELSDSLIEQSDEAGVFVDALPARLDEETGHMRVSVDIRRTTIRGGADSTEGCMGNGVRVRAGGAGAARPGSEAVVVSDSLIEGAREAGIHVQGAEARVERTIVRGTIEGACGGAGDGVAVYGDWLMPARLSLEASLVENSQRAGLAVFGARAEVASSAIRGCAQPAIASVERAGAASVEVTTSWCGCGAQSKRCSPQAVVLAPSLLGGNRCENDGEGVCWHACFDDIIARLGNPTAPVDRSYTPVEALTVWAPESPRIAAARADTDGCLFFGGLPKSSTFIAQLGRGTSQVVPAGFAPYVWRQTTGDFDAIPVRSGALAAQPSSVWAADAPLDLRKAPIANLVVCEPPERPAPGAEPAFGCFHHGVEGVRFELVEGDTGRVYYAANASVPPGQDSLTSDAAGGFVNAEPGRVVVRILPPQSSTKTVSCMTEPFNDGWSSAELVAPDTIALQARSGVNATAFAYCRLL